MRNSISGFFDSSCNLYHFHLVCQATLRIFISSAIIAQQMCKWHMTHSGIFWKICSKACEDLTSIQNPPLSNAPLMGLKASSQACRLTYGPYGWGCALTGRGNCWGLCQNFFQYCIVHKKLTRKNWTLDMKKGD